MLTSSPEFVPQFQNAEGKRRYDLKVPLPPKRQVLHTMLKSWHSPEIRWMSVIPKQYRIQW